MVATSRRLRLRGHGRLIDHVGDWSKPLSRVDLRTREDRQVAGQLDSMKARLADLTDKHVEAESAALQAELEASRAAEAVRSAGK
jgi:hypothetical protein